MRIRSIKPEFWTDKRVASWDHFTRLMFIGLWSAADDHGRGSAEAARLASELFPYDLSRDPSDTLARVAASLERLAADDRITLYEVREEVFFQVVNWERHQRVDNAGKPKNPHISEGVARPSRDPRETRRESPLEQGTGNREQGAGIKEQVAASPWLVKFGLELPESLRTQPCLDAVHLWLTHKGEIRDHYKATGLRMAMAKWANEFTPAEFPGMVEESIARGWKGIFRTKDQFQPNTKPQPAKPHPHQKLADELRAKLENHPADIQRILDTGLQPTQDESREYSQLRDHLAAMLMNNGGGK